MFSLSDHSTIARCALRLACLLSLLAVACSPPATDRALGALTLGLTTEANGHTYRLTNAQFTLEGPEKRTLNADGEDALELDLAAGAYRLTLQPGYQLARAEDPEGASVAAMLVSQNPAPVLVTAGQTARVTLRFELEDGAPVALGAGTLHVGIAVGAADADAGSTSCARDLKINEIDYEQASTDEGEFVELLNTGSCPAQLADVTLELVNGNDGKTYASYALADAAPTLAAGERLVLGDPSVLALLAPEVRRIMLKGSGLQNGPDGVRITLKGQAIDAVAYGDQVAGSTEGTATVADDEEHALARCPDGFDTEDGALDFALATPTAGAENACVDAQNKSATMPSSRSQR